MIEAFNFIIEMSGPTRRDGGGSLAAELDGQEEGEEEGDEEEEDAAVEPEVTQDVRVVVERGGDGDQEEENHHNDEGEAVDDNSLNLKGSPLPAKDSLKPPHSEMR